MKLTVHLLQGNSCDPCIAFFIICVFHEFQKTQHTTDDGFPDYHRHHWPVILKSWILQFASSCKLSAFSDFMSISPIWSNKTLRNSGKSPCLSKRHSSLGGWASWVLQLALISRVQCVILLMVAFRWMSGVKVGPSATGCVSLIRHIH